jgi:hypothetical protein
MTSVFHADYNPALTEMFQMRVDAEKETKVNKDQNSIKSTPYLNLYPLRNLCPTDACPKIEPKLTYVVMILNSAFFNTYYPGVYPPPILIQK